MSRQEMTIILAVYQSIVKTNIKRECKIYREKPNIYSCIV